MSGDEKGNPLQAAIWDMARTAASDTDRIVRNWIDANPGKKPMLRYTVGCLIPEVVEDTTPLPPLDDTPDDTAAPAFPPYTYGERLRNPYYQARRSVWLRMHGTPVETMIHSEADVTDVMQAFGIAEDLGSPAISYQLGEVVAKILRLGRKPGTDVRHEITKCHEHLQAAEDAWMADQEGEK